MSLQLDHRDRTGELLAVGDTVRVTHDFDQAIDLGRRANPGRWVSVRTTFTGRIVNELTPPPGLSIVPIFMLVKFPQWKTPLAISAFNLVKLGAVDAIARVRGPATPPGPGVRERKGRRR